MFNVRLCQLVKPRWACCLPQMNPRWMHRFSSIYTSAAWSSAHATPWSGTWRWIGVCSTVTPGRTRFWERRLSIHTRCLVCGEKWTLVWSWYVTVSVNRLLLCVRRPITTVPLWRMCCCASHGRWTSLWPRWLRVMVWETYWQLYWPPWRSSGTFTLWLVFIYLSAVFSVPDLVWTLGFLYSRFSSGCSLMRIRQWQW